MYIYICVCVCVWHCPCLGCPKRRKLPQMGQLADHLGQDLGCPNYLVDAHATLCTLAPRACTCHTLQYGLRRNSHRSHQDYVRIHTDLHQLDIFLHQQDIVQNAIVKSGYPGLMYVMMYLGQRLCIFQTPSAKVMIKSFEWNF